MAYSAEEKQVIQERVIEAIKQDKTYRQIAEEEGMPNLSTIFRWFEEDSAFANKCARAKTLQAETIDNHIRETIEKVEKGKLSPEQGRVILSGQQWRAAKKNPRVYGERTILAGDSENPINILATRLDQAILKKVASRPATEDDKMIDVTPVIESAQPDSE